MVGSESEQEVTRRNPSRRDGPTHPVWKANLLMGGVVLLLVLLSVFSVLGGQ